MKHTNCALTLLAAATLAFVACGDGSLPFSSTPTEAAFSAPSSVSSLTATFDWSPVSSSALAKNDSKTGGTTYDTFRFTAKATGGVLPYSYLWDFGDGDQANGNPVTHSFYRSGAYTVTLKVDDSAGASTGDKSPKVEIEVSTTPFTMECDANPTTGSAPLTVRFRAWPDGNEGPIEWFWDFGDGATSSTRLAEHTYAGSAGFAPSDASPKCDPTPAPKPSGPATYLAIVTATETQGHRRTVSCKQKITLK
ncbi:MAG: PKD domain-containing protein [Vicinamibacteria bacterium]|nr:PKD domain-containing protein [Vicinamibacteria bacterium]